MSNALDWLWPLLEAPEPLVAAHEVAGWPDGVHHTLLEMGFLVRASDADRVLCPECQGHMEELVAADGPEGSVRFFVPCPEVIRANVPPETRHQWTVNLALVANAVASALSLTGRCKELSPGRLWRLGRTKWKGTTRDVMLARGLHWDDALSVRRIIVRGRRPIVFVPQVEPPDDFWRGRVPPILALSHVATLNDEGVEVDPMEIAAAIQDAEEKASASGTETVISMEQLKLIIRQQMKAEEKTELTDEVYKQAYRHCGSVRKAADFLSEQTGRPVSKDQVHRALQRFGGTAAVLSAEDSDSIVRGVASHCRDKFGKPLVQAQNSKG